MTTLSLLIQERKLKKMAKIDVKGLLDAGVHFGHLTRKWNPNMAPYIYMERNGIHVINHKQLRIKRSQAEENRCFRRKILFGD